MSIRHDFLTVIDCDLCGDDGEQAGNYFDANARTTDELVRSARAAGWHIDTVRHLCPDCYGRLAEQHYDDLAAASSHADLDTTDMTETDAF